MVLWIDEIEKAFASAGSSGDADAGLSQRLLAIAAHLDAGPRSGVFLAGHLQPIFLRCLPEMLRKGRFRRQFSS